MRAIGLAGLLLAAATGSCAGAGEPVKFYDSGADRPKIAALQGKPAPDLAGVRWVQGGPLTLKRLRGKVVLLDISAQW